MADCAGRAPSVLRIPRIPPGRVAYSTCLPTARCERLANHSTPPVALVKRLAPLNQANLRIQGNEANVKPHRINVTLSLRPMGYSPHLFTSTFRGTESDATPSMTSAMVRRVSSVSSATGSLMSTLSCIA